MATGTGTRIRPKKVNQYIGMGAGVVVLGLLGPIVFGHFFSTPVAAAVGAFVGALLGWFVAGMFPAHEASQKPPR